MSRTRKPKPHLIDHASQIAKSGAIQIPTMIKSQIHHFMDEEKPYYELLKYLGNSGHVDHPIPVYVDQSF